MSIQILIAQASILLALSYSLFIFIKFQNIPIKKGTITLIASLIYDGLLTFGKRIFSSTIQAILYTTIVFLLFSQLFSRPFYWNQIAAFFIGGLLICLSSYTCIRIIPKIIRTKHSFACDFSGTIKIFIIKWMIFFNWVGDCISIN